MQQVQQIFLCVCGGRTDIPRIANIGLLMLWARSRDLIVPVSLHKSGKQALRISRHGNRGVQRWGVVGMRLVWRRAE